MKGILAAGFIGIVIMAFVYGISWIATCGLIKLITLCFGWTFKWSIATGVWFILCLLKWIFGNKQ